MASPTFLYSCNMTCQLKKLKMFFIRLSKIKRQGRTDLPKSFMKLFSIFCNKIYLINSYNDAFQKGSLSVCQRRGVISLIPKEDSDLSELSGWRPITLLNVDYKILAKTIAKRIEPFLPKPIHSDQTGFVKDRYIGQNIRLLSDLMEYTDFKKISGILLFSDLEKAFDSVEWKFIMNSLELFNFGPSIRKGFSILYDNVETAVMNAGYMTNYFQVSRGVRQGCPLSPLLFILSVELLASKIRREPNCRGVSLPNHQEAKISQFADDTILSYQVTQNLSDVPCKLLSNLEAYLD